MLGHTFIHALIAATDQEELVKLAEPARGLLIEALALSREQHQALLGGSLGPDAFHGFKNGRRLQQHAFAAAEGTVVDGAVTVVRPVPEIVDLDLDKAGSRRVGHYAVFEGTVEEVGEDGQDAESHFWPRMNANERECLV